MSGSSRYEAALAEIVDPEPERHGGADARAPEVAAHGDVDGTVGAADGLALALLAGIDDAVATLVRQRGGGRRGRGRRRRRRAPARRAGVADAREAPDARGPLARRRAAGPVSLQLRPRLAAPVRLAADDRARPSAG